MLLAIGFMALLMASYMMMSYLGSPSRELDQLIALENRAEELRKRRVYDALSRDKAVRERNQLLVKIARRRRDLASDRKLRANDINRILVARRRAH